MQYREPRLSELYRQVKAHEELRERVFYHCTIAQTLAKGIVENFPPLLGLPRETRWVDREVMLSLYHHLIEALRLAGFTVEDRSSRIRVSGTAALNTERGRIVVPIGFELETGLFKDGHFPECCRWPAEVELLQRIWRICEFLIYLTWDMLLDNHPDLLEAVGLDPQSVIPSRREQAVVVQS